MKFYLLKDSGFTAFYRIFNGKHPEVFEFGKWVICPHSSARILEYEGAILVTRDELVAEVAKMREYVKSFDNFSPLN